MHLIHIFVQTAEEADRFEIRSASVFVWKPFAGTSRVVKVQHRCHRIYPQCVGMILVEPEERIAEQETSNLSPAVIEDEGIPIGMDSATWVSRLVLVNSIEIAEPVLVAREMGRHPIENHSNAILVKFIHQVHEILRRAVAAGGSEVAGDLVTPRAVERMLHDGHELHVSEAHFFHVRNKLCCQFAIGQEAVMLFLGPFPGSQVNLIDRHRG